MLNKIFRKPQNELEKGGRVPAPTVAEDAELTSTCPICKTATPVSQLWEQLNVCKCGYHFRMNARQRLHVLTAPGSFSELYGDLESRDIIGFPEYERKLKNAQLACGEKEAVICGTAKIGEMPCALFVMEPYFMLGSMGTVVGEKITRLFEYAAENSLPVVGFTVSGGARMQEGILSLMQMAKVSGAVRRHSDAGNFYAVVLTDPTTGGITASFAMEADIIIAEPGATIGFTGARIIEQTTRKKLPDGFQKSEFMLEHGFVDLIVPRPKQKAAIERLLKLHERRAAR
ncbi:MAG: acetyl-CoA carboxylase carboxyltransferase subunit beta [Oscillospiraceae bacterium]|nr:acetyl-CoA carboxylase carboxyltransferase subunit beta [Oscillospiraceae bacterium]